MKLVKNQFRLLTLFVIAVFFTLPVKAQVNIGGNETPAKFSILELTTANGGLRLPQLYEDQRDDIVTPQLLANPGEAVGLVIYNMTTNCLEFWNGQKWVSLCKSIENTLTVDPKSIYFHYTASNTNAIVITNVPGGWTVTDKSDWITTTPEEGTNSSGTTLNVAVGMNPDIAPRVDGFITITAGSLSETISVAQWGNPNTDPGGNEGGGVTPANALSYVGAFWRAAETGERVIKFNMARNAANRGTWSASVVWLDSRWGPDDGVVLSAGASADPNIYQANPGNAEDYQVRGENLIVKGEATATNDTVIFRIGLKTKYIGDSPARYAVVLFAYANETKFQKIYLRQGEGADYLMTNDDPVTPSQTLNGNLAQRTSCQRFSPYNLTADALDQAVISQADAAVGAAGNKSRFTDYPTKAGAFFQWANTYTDDPSTMGIRWAINPNTGWTDNPISTTQWTPAGISWSWSNPSLSTYWNNPTNPTLSSNQETCPPGYRRPTDGSTTVDQPGGDISNSEFRQSLFKNPRTGANSYNPANNALWGYYADGYFDRRPLTSYGASPSITQKETTVSPNSSEIAHVGVLFFNPTVDGNHYNASIFLPAVGWRYYNTGGAPYGYLHLPGTRGFYWSSSANYNFQDPPTSCGWAMGFVNSNNNSYQLGSWRVESPAGAAIRCVKE